MARLAALVFDVEGTLAETEEVRRLSINEALRRFHLPWSLDRAAYARLIGREAPADRLKRHISELARDHDHRALELLPDILALEQKLYTRMLEDGAAKFRPGIMRLADEARSRGIKTGLAGTSPRADIETLLIANLDTDGPKRFDAVVGAEDARPGAVYPAVLAALGVPAGQVIAFEDSARCLGRALKAGVRTVVTPGMMHGDEDFAGALAVISHLGEPLDPYEHFSGAGHRDQLVTVKVLERWLADDDDMRGLLTIGGRSLF